MGIFPYFIDINCGLLPQGEMESVEFHFNANKTQYIFNLIKEHSSFINYIKSLKLIV